MEDNDKTAMEDNDKTTTTESKSRRCWSFTATTSSAEQSLPTLFDTDDMISALIADGARIRKQDETPPPIPAPNPAAHRARPAAPRGRNHCRARASPGPRKRIRARLPGRARAS